MSRKEFKCALITGASLGLGRAFARECAARGMDLVLAALPDSGLPELSDAIAREHCVKVDWLEADLTENATLDRLVALIRSKGMAVDLLVNNAGVGCVRPFLDSCLDDHETTIRLNTIALVRLSRLLIDEFEGRENAHILNVASLGAFFPMPNSSVYSGTKSFVLTYSLALRAELSGSVGVSVLCPNAIRTTAVVENYVDQFGLLSRLACLTPERIARIGLDGASRGKTIIIPGFFNRALAAVGRFVPPSLAMRAINHFWAGFIEISGEGRPRSAEALAEAASRDGSYEYRVQAR
jgi:uncharacterized protein